MKKIIVFLLCVFAGFVLVSCNDTNKETKFNVTFVTENNEFVLEVKENFVIGDLPSSVLLNAQKEFLGLVDEDGEWFDLKLTPITRDIRLTVVYEDNSKSSTVLVYKYNFRLDDFPESTKKNNSAGETSPLNGLVWSYGALAFFGAYQLGIQIGSKNNPQITPWTLETHLPEGTKIVSFKVGLCTAASGVSTYSIKIGDYIYSGDIDATNDIAYYGESVSLTTTAFSLTLQATQRAIYLESIELGLELPENHGLNIVGSEILPELSPVSIDLPVLFSLASLNLVDYYSSSTGLAGEALKLALRTKLSNMTKRSYGDARYVLQYTDEAIGHDGYLYGLYDADLIRATWDSGSTWNREHVWACSQMKITSQDRPDESTKNHTSDLHNLRVACGPTNGHHGDSFFDYVDSSTAIFPNVVDGGTIPGSHNESLDDDHRGDIARILFYMWTRYEGLVLGDEIRDINDVNMGRLSALLEWHIADPVDEFEVRRNNRIYEYQGNRNPFIDHPEYVSAIFSNLNTSIQYYQFQSVNTAIKIFNFFRSEFIIVDFKIYL
ncbi:MAG: endonuclease [Acholeplasmatales bacterium]|jgi:endonuclease I|nr:endonuclease [Acholeplasmatales bacterium]